MREEGTERGEARRGEGSLQEAQAVLTEAARIVYTSHADLDSEPFTAAINLIAECRSFFSRVVRQQYLSTAPDASTHTHSPALLTCATLQD